MPTMADQIKVQIRDWDRVCISSSRTNPPKFFFLIFRNPKTTMSLELPLFLFKKFSTVLLTGNPLDGSISMVSQKALLLSVCIFPPYHSYRIGLTKEVALANKMNDGLLEGSCWRGRFLMSFASTSATDPKPSKMKINAPAEPPTTNYTLRFDLLEGAELQTTSDVSVEVTVGLFKKESKKVKVEVINLV